jgi:D-alanyl-D-alanine carboxypeptidase
VTQNFNKLIGRYPGADGFKTGFICASGYNLVASATRDGKRLIAVVLGASSGTMRAVRAAQLLDRGFASNNGLQWLRPSLGTVDSLPPIDASPPNLRDDVCSGKHHKPPSDEDDAPMVTSANGSSNSSETGAATVFLASGLQPPMPKPSEWLAAAPAAAEPIVVYTGPTRTGAALVAAESADADSQAVARHGKGKRARVAAKKPDAAAATATADSTGKPKPVRHANATAKPPAPASDPTAAATKPKPKQTGKPKATGSSAKSSSTDAKPKPAG